jgi:hypothetical protein
MDLEDLPQTAMDLFRTLGEIAMDSKDFKEIAIDLKDLQQTTMDLKDLR